MSTSAAERTRPERDLRENLDYAEDLGAEVIRTTASKLLDGLTDVVRRRRATHLLLPYHATRTMGGFRRPSLAEAVLRELPALEVHLVAEEPPAKTRSAG